LLTGNREQQQPGKGLLTWLLLIFFPKLLTEKVNPKGGQVSAKEGWEGTEAAALYHPITLLSSTLALGSDVK